MNFINERELFVECTGSLTSRRVLSHFSCDQPFVTLQTVVHQAPLSMEFSRQEYWSGFLCPPPGDFPDSGIKPTSLLSPALAGGFLTSSTTWEALPLDTMNQKQTCPYLYFVGHPSI